MEIKKAVSYYWYQGHLHLFLNSYRSAVLYIKNGWIVSRSVAVCVCLARKWRFFANLDCDNDASLLRSLSQTEIFESTHAHCKYIYTIITSTITFYFYFFSVNGCFLKIPSGISLEQNIPLELNTSHILKELSQMI